uniref:LRRCT domain-containing protein n=1 Tax=Pseudonaja textilis TaxID=8673 RepID=A0A670ZQH7_PSETE
MRPPAPPLLIACLVMSLNSYTQQVPPCLPQFLGPESFLCNSWSLRKFPSGFPNETKIIAVDSTQISNLAIPPDCFHKLTLLLSLDLSSNLLRCLSPEMFQGLTFLEFLNLINNPIVSITPDTFRGTPMLLVLSLGNNSLTHVPPGLFRSLENLERLDLSANEITSLEAPLVNVSSEFTLDLSGNPWACDCRLQALFNWARESNVDWLSKENVVCAFPKSLRGKTMDLSPTCSAGMVPSFCTPAHPRQNLSSPRPPKLSIKTTESQEKCTPKLKRSGIGQFHSCKTLVCAMR